MPEASVGKAYLWRSRTVIAQEYRTYTTYRTYYPTSSFVFPDHLLKSNRVFCQPVQHSTRFIANRWIVFLFTNGLEDFAGDELSSHLGNICAATHIGVDRCRQNSNHDDTMLRQVGTKRLTERHQSRFGCAVGTNQRQIDFRKCRSDVHDCTLPLLDHHRCKSANHPQSSKIVNFNLLLSSMEVHRYWIAIPGNTSIVDQNVHTAELCDGIHVFVRGDVELYRLYVGTKVCRIRS